MIAENLQTIRSRIDAAAKRAGRSPNDITLLAVSKLQPAQLIRDAYAAGQRDFGENYAQELRDKAAELADLKDLRWHAIGPLQTNKAKYVAKAAYAFHALDRLDVAEELSKKRTQLLRCFVEVNVAGEASKSGIEPDALPDFLAKIRKLPNLEAVGLMSLPPLSEDPRPYFRKLKKLAEAEGLKELSMGTTADFEAAIEEGATIVRVGTAIFGERQKR
ncbi:MAG: YggS family pyridoxal phosphate-dependent enzyme [Myxococcaceae bacterium]